MSNVLRGRLHVHSENSLKDSANKVEDIARKAKEIGLDAVALTDHGNVTGWQSFTKACKKEGIKPILGVEAYVVDDAFVISDTEETDKDILAEKSKTRLHMIFLGLDSIGRNAISLMVTESNNHIVKAGKNTYPCMDKKIIEKYAGKNSKAYGHIIATSACVGGILAGLSIQNDSFMEEFRKIVPENTRQTEIREALVAYQKEKTDIEARKKKARELSKKAYTKRLKLIEKETDPDKKQKMQEQIEKEMAQSERAKTYIQEVEPKLRTLNSNISACRKEMCAEEKYQRNIKREDFLVSRILSDEELLAKMEEEAIWWNEMIGQGYFYIELQYHGIEREKKWMPALLDIANRHNIPITVANDEHLIEKEDVTKRAYLGAMRFKTFQYYEPDATDSELYFKTDSELANKLLEIIPDKNEIKRAFYGVSSIIARCDDCEDVISPQKHYPKFEKEWSKEQTCEYLENMARNGIQERYGEEWNETLENRLKYELGIIESMGFEDYFLIVAWYIQIGKKLGKMPLDKFEMLQRGLKDATLEQTMRFINKYQNGKGYSVGPGRGSGAGSIVCYLIGITSIDPIKYNLVFERFLNPERVSMPDIDSDFSMQIRETLIEIVKKKYGQNGVAFIMTRGTLGAKYAIQNCAKVYGSKTKNDSKAFLSLADDLSNLVPKIKGHVKDIRSAADIKYPTNEDVKEILDAAEGLEGTYIQTGKHAAGVVIADNGDIREYTALLWDPDEKNWKTQLDKDEVEENHLLKMDFLGLKYLDIITETLRLIDKKIDPDKDIQIEPEVIKMFSDADTDQIFQFESEGMKRMLEQFHPTSFEDLILLVAAYRPGPMQFLPEVFKVKKGADPEYLTPELEPILKDTYGQIIYQEQVMQIFQKLAGYSLGGADLVRRAMGHKEKEKLDRERGAFVYGDPSRNIVGCKNNGIDTDAANKLFDQMQEFASYAFNKSHAAAYAWISYITAWLKYHYTLQFMTAVIRINGNSDAKKGEKKIVGILRDCKKHGVDVVCPDINISKQYPSICDGKIYLGFNSIKNVAAAAAPIEEERRNGLFTSPPNLLTRCKIKKDSFVSLCNAGAFDALCDRTKLIAGAEDLFAETKKTEQLTNDIELKSKMLQLLKDNKKDEAAKLNNGKVPSLKTLTNRVADLEKQLKSLEQRIERRVDAEEKKEFDTAILLRERDALGVFVSGSPLDSYIPVCKSGRNDITNLEPRRSVRILTFAEDVEEKISKKDGSLYISFNAETPLGNVRAFCFDSETAMNIKDLNEPFIAEGVLRADRRAEDEEGNGETSSTLMVFSIKAAQRKSKPVRAKKTNKGKWSDIQSLNPKNVAQEFVILNYTRYGDNLEYPCDWYISGNNIRKLEQECKFEFELM